MRAKEFPEVNVVMGKDQPEYLSLPAYKSPEGHVICCFEVDKMELRKIRKTREIWLGVLTFNQPLQPVLIQAECPFDLLPGSLEKPEAKKRQGHEKFLKKNLVFNFFKRTFTPATNKSS